MQLSMQWMALPPSVRKKLQEDCHHTWALWFFTNNIPFQAIEHPLFKKAVMLTMSQAAAQAASRMHPDMAADIAGASIKLKRGSRDFMCRNAWHHEVT